MAISIALLGLGTSGMAIYLFPKFFSKAKSFRRITWCFILYSCSVLLVLFSLLTLEIEIKATMSSVFELALIYILLILPFFFGGLIISLILTHFPEKISKLYFYDLIGASLGSIGVIFLLKYIGGPNGLILIALLGLFGAIVLGTYYKYWKVSTLASILFIASSQTNF